MFVVLLLLGAASVHAANPESGITSRGLVVVPTELTVDAYDEVLFEARLLGFSAVCPSTPTLEVAFHIDPTSYTLFKYQWSYRSDLYGMQIWGATYPFFYLPYAWPSLEGYYECLVEYDQWWYVTTSEGGGGWMWEHGKIISDPDGHLLVNPPPPDPPVGLRAETVNHQKINLTWECYSPYVDTFYIERRADVTGSETFALLEEVEVDDEEQDTYTYEDASGLQADTRYVYRVKCGVRQVNNDIEYSGYSNEAAARTVDFVLCTP